MLVFAPFTFAGLNLFLWYSVHKKEKLYGKYFNNSVLLIPLLFTEENIENNNNDHEWEL